MTKQLEHIHLIRLLLLTILLLISANVHSQSRKAESIIKLRTALKKAEGVRKANIMNQLTAEWFSVNLDSAKKYGKRAKTYIEKNDIGQAKTKMYLNLFEIEMLDTLSVRNLDYLYKAESIAKQRDNKDFYISSLNKLANNFIENGNYLKATSLLDEASQQMKGGDFKPQLAYNLYLKGKVAAGNSNIDLAKQYFDKSLNIHLKNKAGNPTGIFSEVGNIYFHSGQYQTALKTYQEALPFIKDYGDRIGEGYIEMNIGLALTELGYYDKAKNHFKHALEVKRAYKSNADVLLVRTYMIDNLIRSNNKNLAKEWIDRSFDKYRNKEHKYMHLLYQRKAEWYYEEGQKDSAYHYFKRADSIAKINDKDIDPIAQLKYAITKDHASFIGDVHQKAKEHYLMNNNEVMLNRAKLVLAEHQYLSGRYSRSIDILKTIDLKLKASPEIVVRKADLLIRNYSNNEDEKGLGKAKEYRDNLLDQLRTTQLSNVFQLTLTNNILNTNQKKMSDLKYWVNWLSLSSIGTALLLILLWQYNKRRHKQLAQNYSQKELNLKESLSRAEKQHKKEIKEKIDLLKSRNHFLSELKEMVNENYHEKPQLIRKDIKEIFNSIDEQLRSSGENLKDDILLLEEDYIKKLTERYPNLSAREMRLCIYIKMGFSNQDIASLSNIQHSSVDKSRYRLRKKMDLDRNVNLQTHLTSI